MVSTLMHVFGFFQQKMMAFPLLKTLSILSFQFQYRPIYKYQDGLRNIWFFSEQWISWPSIMCNSHWQIWGQKPIIKFTITSYIASNVSPIDLTNAAYKLSYIWVIVGNPSEWQMKLLLTILISKGKHIFSMIIS